MMITANVVIQQSMKFTGSVTIDGKPFWDYSGSWSLAGSTLTWKYETSSRDQPAAGTVDTDEVISVNRDRLVLLSKLSGQQREFLRTK